MKLVAAHTLDERGRDLLRVQIRELEQQWRAGSQPELSGLVPPPESPHRAAILVELVKVDQEFRWMQGQPRFLEAYLTQWPELDADAVVAELLEAECVNRITASDSPSVDDLRSRFPDRAGRIDFDSLLESARELVSPPAVAIDTSRADACRTVGDAPGRSPLRVGQTFGRYTIEENLGAGGMGWVYRARDTHLKRDIALKAPRTESNLDPAVVQRFVREAESAARLHHPNVCPIYDAGQIDGVFYIAMALIQGYSLADRVRNGPLPPREAAELLRKIARALHAVHAAGIVHRDIKATNVMIDASGEPLLMDFGLARPLQSEPLSVAEGEIAAGAAQLPSSGEAAAAESGQPMTTAGMLLGTPAYMSPEQVRRQAADFRSDIYSLGVLFYQMLTGQLPFRGSLPQILAAITGEETPSPRAIQPEVDPQLDTMCRKAMSKDPDERYQSAAEMTTAVEAYLQTAAAPLSKAGGAVPPKRRRVLLAGMGAAALVLCGWIIKIVIEWKSTPPPPPPEGGWGLPRGDDLGTRCYPYATKKRLDDSPFVPRWSVKGTSVFTGDVNRDGKMEVVVGDGQSLRIYDAAGKLLKQKSDAGWLYLMADVDGDGYPEMVVSRAEGEKLLLRVYDGACRRLKEMSMPGTISPLREGFNPQSGVIAAAVADLQANGDQEIVAHTTSEGGNETRGFAVFNYPSGKQLWHQSIGPGLIDFAVGDVRKIGVPQLFFATVAPDNGVRGGDGTIDNQCFVYCLNAARTEVVWRHQFAETGFAASNVILSDIDGDGELDIAAASRKMQGNVFGGGSGNVYLLDPATGKPRPEWQRAFPGPIQLQGIAGFTGERHKQLVCVLEDSGKRTRSVVLLDGKKGFPTLHQYRVPGSQVDLQAIADINGDGKLEAIVASVPLDDRTQPPVLHVLDSELKLLWQWRPPKPGALGNAVITDVDGDGVNEILCPYDGRVYVLSHESPPPVPEVVCEPDGAEPVAVARWLECGPDVGSIEVSRDQRHLYALYGRFPAPDPITAFEIATGKEAPALAIPFTEAEGVCHKDAVASSDGRYLYVTNYYNTHITRVTLATGEKARVIVGPWAQKASLTPDKKKLIVNVGGDGRRDDLNDDGLAVVDVADGKFALLDRLKTPDEIFGQEFGFNADGSRVYAATTPRTSKRPELIEVSLTTPARLLHRLPFDTQKITGVVVSGKRNCALVADAGQRCIWRVDLDTFLPVERWKLGSFPVDQIYMPPDESRLWVLARESRKVFVLSPDDGSVEFRIDGLRDGPNDIAFSPDGKTAYIGAVAPRGGVAVVPLPTRKGRIAFASNRAGEGYQLHLMDPSTAKVTRLSDHHASDRHPRWAPRGNTLALASNRGGAWRVWTLCPGDKSATELAATEVSDTDGVSVPFDWSPDGAEIYYIPRSARAVCAYNRRTKQTRTLLDRQPADGVPVFNMLSCDRSDGTIVLTARSAATSVVQDLFRVDPKSGRVARVTQSENETIIHLGAACSPDGSRIAAVFSPKAHHAVGNALGLLSRTGAAQKDFLSPKGTHLPARWTADGKTLVFSTLKDGRYRLQTVSASGGAPKELPGGNWDDVDPDPQGEFPPGG